jgi:hypothetical protein
MCLIKQGREDVWGSGGVAPPFLISALVKVGGGELQAPASPDGSKLLPILCGEERIILPLPGIEPRSHSCRLTVPVFDSNSLQTSNPARCFIYFIRVVCAMDPYGRNLGFLDRGRPLASVNYWSDRYISFV